MQQVSLQSQEEVNAFVTSQSLDSESIAKLFYQYVLFHPGDLSLRFLQACGWIWQQCVEHPCGVEVPHIDFIDDKEARAYVASIIDGIFAQTKDILPPGERPWETSDKVDIMTFVLKYCKRILHLYRKIKCVDNEEFKLTKEHIECVAGTIMNRIVQVETDYEVDKTVKVCKCQDSYLRHIIAGVFLKILTSGRADLIFYLVFSIREFMEAKNGYRIDKGLCEAFRKKLGIQ